MLIFMKHFKTYFILLFLLVFFNTSNAQVPQFKKIVDSLRVDVYNRVMELNTEEQKNFWEIHNQMQTELDAITLERMKARVKVNRASKQNNLNKEQILQQLNTVFDLQDKETDIKRKYYPKILETIPAEKAILMLKAEKEFKKLMLEKLKNARNR